VPDEATRSGRSRRIATVSSALVTAGTTEDAAIADTSANEASSRARRAPRRCSSSSAEIRDRVPARRVETRLPVRNSPSVTFVFPTSTARSMAR
jgi:hypothetical protein